jgi:hypothetical protein
VSGAAVGYGLGDESQRNSDASEGRARRRVTRRCW